LNNEQLDFAFVAELPIATVLPKKKGTRSKATPASKTPVGLARTSVALSALADPGASTTPGQYGANPLEAMAATLEAHPDYRIQRRLQPRLVWEPTSGQAVCRVVILDTETTGLDASKDKIMELAMLRVDVDLATGIPVGAVQVYDGLEDPGIPIPKEIQEITGITPDMVHGQRLDEARVAALLDGVDLVIAHNAGFDRPFCEARMARFQDLAWACSWADIPWKEHGRGSAKLESLAAQMGWFYDAHRAEMDCHALLAILATPLPRAAHTGLAHLVSGVGAASYRLQATNAPFEAKDLLKARGYRWSAEHKVWHTRIGDEGALQAELAWLKAQVYQQRSAMLVCEKMQSSVRYSARPGEIIHHRL
jgi:DNA polymerase-3 subunit epsilon